MTNITSIGFILDGNRRYGVKKKISYGQAYTCGAKKALAVIEHIYKKHKNIKQIHLFTLSKENIDNRKKKEINELFSLFKKNKDSLKDLSKKNINIKFLGRFDKLPNDFVKEIKSYNKQNKRSRLTVYFCLGYGGRQEIIDAVNKIRKKNLKKITDKTFRNYLYGKDVIDPNVIVRTSGTKRLSGFMLYYSAYSELIFINKLWPEITTKDVDKIVKEYENVKRNFGA